MSEENKRQGRIEPYEYGEGTARELAKYKTPLAFVREAGANVNDQSKEPSSQEKNRPTMRIYVSKLHKRIWIEDWQTGILNMGDFLIIGNRTTSTSDGKHVGDMISSDDNIIHDIIGKKHFGKLSYLFASKIGDVEYWSNNGKNGHYLHGYYNGWETFDDSYGWKFRVMDTTSALPHIGLKICINDPKDICLNVKTIGKAAQNYFDVLIAKNRLRILLTDMDKKTTFSVLAPEPHELNTSNEKTDSSLAMSKGGNIMVNLTKTEEMQIGNNIRVYNKDVFVCDINRNQYMVKGRVNWDGFELNKEREGYEDDVEFTEKFDKYLSLNFPLVVAPKHTQKIGNKTEEQIQEIVNEVFTAISRVHAELLPEGLFGPLAKFGIKGAPTKPKHKKTDITRGPPTHDPCPAGSHWDAELGKCVKIEKEDDEEEGGPPKDEEKRIRLDIKTQGGEFGNNLNTMFFRLVPIGDGKMKLELCINWSKPASEVLTKPGDDKRRRDVLYDKFIRAAYRLTYKGNDINEFENLVDETWNALYIPELQKLVTNK